LEKSTEMNERFCCAGSFCGSEATIVPVIAIDLSSNMKWATDGMLTNVFSKASVIVTWSVGLTALRSTPTTIISRTAVTPPIDSSRCRSNGGVNVCTISPAGPLSKGDERTACSKE
jgi:hypothetical protein